MRRNISAFTDHFVLILLALSTSIPGAMAQANLQGQWSTLPYLMPINPVHVALLHNGKVLVVSGSGNYPPNLTANNLTAAVWDPATTTINIQSIAWDMFCGGMVVLPDGRPFLVGGTLQYNPFHGQPKASVFDPASNTFADVQNMAHGRWYPTVTTLGDGRVMTFSGLDESGNTNTTVEIYTVGSGWSPQYSASWTPPLYPRMHLLPNGNVFYSGASTYTRTFNTSTHAWANVATTEYSGRRTYGTSVLLPLRPANNYVPRVIIMGGGNPSTTTTELIDLSATTPKWQWGPNMSQPRIEMNAVILPNGKILAVGGSYNDEDTSTASLNADLYDPSTNAFSSAGANVYARLYHSVALLLPDATVWLAGGNPKRGTYEQHMEIYQPEYLFTTDLNGNIVAAPRPSFSGAPSNITYGNSFTVQTPNPTNIASVVLVRNGSVTHAFDMDQRLIELSFTPGSGALTMTAPPSGNIAPPGYYMLFVLNSSGVPSVASFVQLGSQPDSSSPSITTTTLPGGAQNVAYSATLAASGGTQPYAWTITTGTLPSGLSLNSSTGVISGTPTGSGTSSFTVQVTDANSQTATQGLSITIAPPPTITTTTLPAGEQNVAYSATLAASGGTQPYAWTITLGTLPSGLNLNSSTGVISGTPTGSGTSSFTVQVTDANSQAATQGLSITISPPPSITTTTLPAGAQNVAYSTTLAASGGTQPYTWTITLGTLPSGLGLNSSTGVISGTPTASGTSSFTVQVTDANSQTATQGLRITITSAPSITTTTLPSGVQNVAYTATLAASGGTQPYAWAITTGTLPSGLNLNSSTGVISGTPTGSGTSSFTVQVTDANFQTATQGLSITIAPIGLVQSAAVQGSSVLSISQAFPANNTAGNLIVVFVRASTTSQTVTVTDTAGNTYALAVSQTQTSDGHQIRIFYATSAVSSPNTVTATFSATNNHPWLALFEFAGVSGLDQTAHAQGSGTSPHTGLTATTTSNNELVFAGLGLPNNSTATATAGAGFQLLLQDAPPNTSRAATEGQIVSVSGQYRGTFSLSAGRNWSAVVATFK